MRPENADFEQLRGWLTGLAYRMTGTLADAEDVVQDAWLRWRRVDRARIEHPERYLASVVTRLCLDRLRRRRREREIYVGPWLPEPVLEDPAAGAEEGVFASDISFALMLALERLSPLERAAFILHDVFDVAFREIARTLGRSEAACRQLASRARANIRAGRRRFAVGCEEGEAMAEAFFRASRSGDIGTLRRLLAEGATLHSDGGGRKIAALNVIAGADRIGRFFAGIARKAAGSEPEWRRRVHLNGLPGELTVEADGTRQAMAIELAEGRIAAVYLMRNPAKLDRLWAAAERRAPGGAEVEKRAGPDDAPDGQRYGQTPSSAHMGGDAWLGVGGGGRPTPWTTISCPGPSALRRKF